MKKFLILFLFFAQFGFTDDLDIQISGNLKAILGSSQSTDWSVVSATDVSASNTVSAATFIFSASGIPLYVGDTSTSDSGKALIYDATANSINLLPITDYLDFATVGSSLSFGGISDVSVEWAAEGWVPAWNAASEIWEATPAAEYTPSITESEVATMIQSATESLTPSEIGAVDTATMNTTIETAVSNATSTLTLDELDNVSLSGKSDGDVVYWDAGAEVWSATPQATGGTGGAGETFDPSTLRIPYIVSVTYLGSPAAAAKMLYHAVPRSVTFAAGLTDSQAICETVATAETTFSIRKNNTEFGTATFAIGSTTGTFAAASQTVFTTGDILSIVAPDPADDTLAQIGITLLGEQGVIAE